MNIFKLITVLAIAAILLSSTVSSLQAPKTLGVSAEVFNKKILTVGINPEEDGETLVEKYFNNYDSNLLDDIPAHTDIENRSFDSAIDAFSRLSGGRIQYNIVAHMNIDTFPLLPNNQPIFDMDSYGLCINGTPEQGAACDANKWDFSYTKFFDQYDICEAADAEGVDEIWLMTPPFIGKWESLIVGPTDGFWLNGVAEIAPACSKLYPVMGPTYDRPENLLHNFGHRIEATIERTFSNVLTSESEYYWQRFIGFAGQPLGCGNTHYPKNFRGEYDYSNPATATSVCPDWSNFPNFTDETETVGCAAWGCNDAGWEEYWFAFIPANEGTTIIHNTDNDPLVIENDWWKYILDVNNVQDFFAYSENPGAFDDTCSSYEYTNWSSCTSGTQTRSVITSYPVFCSDGEPVLSRSCTLPVITQVTPVTTPIADRTPSYSFSSNKIGTITYGGSCSSSTSTSVVGTNTIVFNSLATGTYSNCTIKITDTDLFESNTLNVNSFTISFKANADFNNDSRTDLSDLSILATYWNQNNSSADSNNDGVVDISDLSILAVNWLHTF